MRVVGYRYRCPNLPAMRLAVIADLHGIDPSSIIEQLGELHPDAILVPGDLFRKSRGESGGERRSRTSRLATELGAFTGDALIAAGIAQDPSKMASRKNARSFVVQSSRIAPTIISRGNHDCNLNWLDETVLHRTRNVWYLDNDDAVVNILGTDIAFGGLSHNPDYRWLDGFAAKSKAAGLPAILLCHRPECYRDRIAGRPALECIELTVAGHAHGGQWRIFGRPLVSSTDGLLPRCAYGRHGRLIVSAGVANTQAIPRLGNPTEIVIIDVR